MHRVRVGGWKGPESEAIIIRWPEVRPLRHSPGRSPTVNGTQVERVMDRGY